MKDKRHLDFYKKSMKSGHMPEVGLCDCVGYKKLSAKLLKLMYPTVYDQQMLISEGFSTGYWASGFKTYERNKSYTFTPLRQTIVLFMAALNDEL